MKRKAPMKRRKTTGMPKGLRESVFVRANGHCDRCGTGLRPTGWECHHRSPRGMGGGPSKNYAENLLALHPECHAWVESNRADARDLGYLVPDWQDPRVTPVFRHQSRWQLPTETEWTDHEQA